MNSAYDVQQSWSVSCIKFKVAEIHAAQMKESKSQLIW